ncbi:hypothetical protein [Lacinutrix sp.]|uniref:hypothetical protein n=1 Tax=Lacinutrix sp. TaxID=1937692 RepID=UPI0035C7DE99
MNSKLKDILNKKAKTLERKRKVVLLWSKVYRIIIVPLKITFRACSFILAIICAAFPPALVYLLITGVIYFLLEIINNPLKAYNNNFKKNIIPAIYKELNTSITYYPSAIQVSDIKKADYLNHLILIIKHILKETTMLLEKLMIQSFLLITLSFITRL